MKLIAMSAVVCGALALAGCNDDADAKAPKQAAASQAVAAQSAPAASPAASAKPEVPRVGHRMQLDPVSGDKFKLGPQGAKQNGSK